MPEMTELWMCNFHNTVNERLGKELYNCDEFIPIIIKPGDGVWYKFLYSFLGTFFVLHFNKPECV